MAIISTWKQYIDGKNVTLKLKCNANGVFSINVPQLVYEKVDCPETIKGKRKDDVMGQWQQLIAQLNESATTEEIVIVYAFRISAHILDGALNVHKDEISFSKGLGLTVYVGKYRKKTTRTSGSVKSRYIPLVSTIPPSATHAKGINNIADDVKHGRAKELPWSEEREVFFRNIITSMENLILNLSSLLDNDNWVDMAIGAGDFQLLPAYVAGQGGM